MYPFKSSGVFNTTLSTALFPNSGASGYLLLLLLLLLLLCFIEIPVVNSNSVDPDQTPRSAASDLGLHCLPVLQTKMG